MCGELREIIKGALGTRGSLRFDLNTGQKEKKKGRVAGETAKVQNKGLSASEE